MSTRLVAVSVGIASAVVGAAGCSGSSGGSPAASTGSPQPSATVTVTETASSHPSPSATPTPSPSQSVAAAPACTTAHLSLSIGSGQGAAGSSYQPIVFTNTAKRPCSLYGYPGVSFIDSAGTQLGLPAAHPSGSKQLVTLAGHGGTASALLQEPDPGVFSAANCQQATAARLKVYPPNQTAALLVDDPVTIGTTKKGRARVRPVVPGSSGE